MIMIIRKHVILLFLSLLILLLASFSIYVFRQSDSTNFNQDIISKKVAPTWGKWHHMIRSGYIMYRIGSEKDSKNPMMAYQIIQYKFYKNKGHRHLIYHSIKSHLVPLQ